MPTISRSLVNPFNTPCTALANSARVRPCAAACSSAARTTCSSPASSVTRTPLAIGTVSLPLGPVTSSVSPICTLTPFGRGIGFFPTLDICFPRPLPDAAENLSAHFLAMRGAAGHYAARRRQDVDTQTAEHARDILLSHVDAAARTRNALDLRDHRPAVGAVFEIDLDGLLGALFRDLEIGN